MNITYVVAMYQLRAARYAAVKLTLEALPLQKALRVRQPKRLCIYGDLCCVGRRPACATRAMRPGRFPASWPGTLIGGGGGTAHSEAFATGWTMPSSVPSEHTDAERVIRMIESTRS
jgi:hypothetical protein